jgi:hypothetical protein
LDDFGGEAGTTLVAALWEAFSGLQRRLLTTGAGNVFPNLSETFSVFDVATTARFCQVLDIQNMIEEGSYFGLLYG